MRVKIKLRDMGVKRQPKVWLIVQPQKKNLKGKYLEKIGVWHPKVRKTVARHIAINTHRANYWLSVGAIPTRGAHRVLARYGILPELPAKYGSVQQYNIPEREYHKTHFWGFGKIKFGANQVAFHYKQKLQEQMNLIERKRRLATTAMNTDSGAQAVAAIDHDAEDTDDIDSDDPDIFERTKKFDTVLKKLEKHKQDKYLKLKGNDLRYNVYLKKLQKLARKDLGLDVAAYKDYVNNLKEFAHINKDMNIFAAENLALDANVSEMGLLQIEETSKSGAEIQTNLEGRERVQANVSHINMTIAKFLRTNSAFVSNKDRRALKELQENMSLYVLNDGILCNQLRQLYMRRKREQSELMNKDLMFDEFLKLDASAELLEQANVSKREFLDIQMLCKFDRDIFLPESEYHLPNDLLVDNPYSFFVDFNRLPADIPKKIKLILYRPERMARLKKAYMRVAVELNYTYQKRVNEKKEWARNKRIRLDYHQRQPAKTQEELALIDELVKCIDTDFQIIGEDGLRQINQGLLDPRPPISEYTDINDWQKPIVARLIEERRKLPKQERLEKFRNDSVDEVDTTDLEQWSLRGFRSLGENYPGGSKEKIQILNNKMHEETRFQKKISHMVNRHQRNQEGVSAENRRLTKKQEIYEILREMQQEFVFGDLKARQNLDIKDDDEISGPEESDGTELWEQETPEYDARGNERFPGTRASKNDPSKMIIFDGDERAERRRFNERHRIDHAKMYFGKDGGYSIRELKRMYKTEIEENPERYMLDFGVDIDEAERKAAEEASGKIYNDAVAEGPIFDVTEDKTEELKELRKELDEYIPKLKKKMEKRNYQDDAEYQAMVREILVIEKEISDNVSDVRSRMIDEKIRGEGAKFATPFFDPEVPLLPGHLRYMARQLSMILRIRQYECLEDLSEERDAVNFDETVDEENEYQDVVHEDDKPISFAKFDAALKPLEEDALDGLLGPVITDSINNKQRRLDVSELTFMDPDIGAQVDGMSDEYVQSQIDKMLEEATKNEEKLNSMSLRDRAKLDQYHEYSLMEHDHQNAVLLQEYNFRRQLQISVEKSETKMEDLEEKLQDALKINPKLQEWYDKFNGGQVKEIENLAKEMTADGSLNIDPEELEAILTEIINKDGLHSKELAFEYYEKMYAKITKKTRDVDPVKKQFLDPKAAPEDPFDLIMKGDKYDSQHINDFTINKKTLKAFHEAKNNSIGRYPHNYRQYENFVNYSQVKKDATIQEYMEVMNKPCEYYEYLKIRSSRLVEDTQTPEFKHQWRSDVIEDYKKRAFGHDRDEEGDFAMSHDQIYTLTEDGIDLPEKVQDYLATEEFEDLVKRDYAELVQTALLDKKHFTFVDAIEEHMDFWEVGRDLFHLPTHNVYIPVRNTIMKKPLMGDEDIIDDELGYMYNNYDSKDKTRQRFSPMDQLSPLRSNRMGPGRPRVIDSYHRRNDNARGVTSVKPRYFKFRRLSNVKDNAFSTATRAYTPTPSAMQDGMVRQGAIGVSIPTRFFKMMSPFRQE